MNNDKSFIEVQFPVSKVSKESYKERKSAQGQTLTGLGKWWGRKPLVLVRAALLGLLFPASDEPKKDMDIFLKIMSMDKNGLLNRKSKSISAKAAFEILTTRECEQYFAPKDSELAPSWKADITAAEKATALEKAWSRMSYDQKLSFCVRPEEYANENPAVWNEINEHLGTKAVNLQELIEELGVKKFGHRAVVGDCFCGGGSVPFEAARLGCDAFASDLNPVAGLLSWANLNLLNLPKNQFEKIQDFQLKIYDELTKKVEELGIERNELGWRARYYLYCTEVICPEQNCNTRVPLAASWVTSERQQKTAVELIFNPETFSYIFVVKDNLTASDLKEADKRSTVQNNRMICPHCGKQTPIVALRNDRKNDIGIVEYGLRAWESDEFTPRQVDTFNERLYCICYEEIYHDTAGKLKNRWHFVAPDENDIKREDQVQELLKERFANWQKQGYIPSSVITEGEKTTELIRNRGWTHWHHLFNPRQLLINGLLMELIDQFAQNREERVVGLLGLNKCVDALSKLSRWHSGVDKAEATFYNQALNTLFNYGTRTTLTLRPAWFYNLNGQSFRHNNVVKLTDARDIDNIADIWITDPPYADAVNYHELSEFFLAWNRKLLKKAFPDWYVDSKRVLAVRGRDETFINSMIEVYKNLAANMPDNGMQIIMFTHQDVSVWADLRNIVWSAGLQVTAAWTIATETESAGIKVGNYVKGTVLLVLRKRKSEKTAFLDEIMPEVEDEVKAQIRSMQLLDDKEEQNFTDADYILAAYAASLKVLTSYKNIDDIDVTYELSRVRKSGELSPVAQVIESAKKIAYDELIPSEFDPFMWKALSAEERLYIKGLELEKNNIYQLSAYQELARGFGVNEYKDFMENSKANFARFKTANEWAGRNISGDGFAGTLLRNVFMALYLASKDDDNVVAGKNWIKNEVSTYDGDGRKIIIEFLGYVATFEHINNMSHWKKEASMAVILKELVSNDGV
jgi:adenine-specific DNA methylase